MPAYGRAFAQAYDLRWSGFARNVAPPLLAFYLGTPAGQARQPVLDICCGNGVLAARFLEQGWPVTGLDLSPAMLALARANTGGRASLLLADAARFALAPRFGLAVATYDALNHLPDFAALRGCLASAAAALAPGGYLIFDLNTRRGLERWTLTSVDDHEAALVITRGRFEPEQGRALLNITGFVRDPAGRYERFDETVFNTIFEIQAVLAAAREAGFASAHAARLEALGAPLADPEAEQRVFILARRPG